MLSDEEKQSLAIARALLQRPSWVVLNRALDAAFRRRMMEACHLADVGVLYIGPGSPPNEGGFFGRTLNLALDPHGQTFKPAVEASAALGGQSAREAAPAK
jgi:ABC-type uncharacterized transport system fused permease/ATPase subunit